MKGLLMCCVQGEASWVKVWKSFEVGLGWAGRGRGRNRGGSILATSNMLKPPHRGSYSSITKSIQV